MKTKFPKSAGLLTGLAAACLVALTIPQAHAAPGDQVAKPLGSTSAPYGYLEYLPLQYDNQPTVQWPVILFLHGAGEIGNGSASDLTKVDNQGLPARLSGSPGSDYDAVIISPQSPSQGWNMDNLNAMVDYILATYRVDPDRLIVTGLSAGGGGTWGYLTAHPERLAAAVPICGTGSMFGDPAPDINTFKDVPLWAFHGEVDTSQKPNQTVDRVQALIVAGGDPRMTIFYNRPHDCWTETYNTPALYTWMFQQRRNPSGITVSGASVTPAVIPTNVASTIVVNANVTDSGGGSIQAVTVDLSPLGGSGTAAMTHIGSGNYTLSYTVPSGQPRNGYTLILTAVDNTNKRKDAQMEFSVESPALPSGISASSVSTGTNRITWSAGAPGPYRIYTSMTGPITEANKASAIVLNSSVADGVTSFNHVLADYAATNVTSNTPFYYAVNSLSEGATDDHWLEIQRKNNGGFVQIYYNTAHTAFPVKDAGYGHNALELLVRDLDGSYNWYAMELWLKAGSAQVRVSMGDYMDAALRSGGVQGLGARGEHWTRVSVPLDDFLTTSGSHVTTAQWTAGVSYVGFKTGNTYWATDGNFGLDEVRFTGGTTPFVWYGDSHDTIGQTNVFTTTNAADFNYVAQPTSGGFGGSRPLAPNTNATTTAVNNQVPGANNAPDAVSDSVTAIEGQDNVFAVLDNDVDTDGPVGLVITALGTPAHGIATLISGSTQVQYTPTAGYYGSDSFTYTVSDSLATDTATVNVTVIEANDLVAQGLTGTDLGIGGGSARDLDTVNWEINGTGGVLNGATTDSGHMEQLTQVGNFQILTRMRSLTGGGAQARGGLMIREGTGANARMVYVATTPGTNYVYGSRTTTGGVTAETTGTAYAYPDAWMLLQRTGSMVSISASSDGGNYTGMSSVTLAGLSGTLNIGPYVTNGGSGTSARAEMSDFEVIPMFSDIDIGVTNDPGASPDHTYNTSTQTATVTGRGSVIWSGSDRFHFTYVTLTGTGEISARVSNMTGGVNTRKMGVMMRDTLLPGSMNAFMFVTGTNNTAMGFSRRLVTSSTTYNTNISNPASPFWVRLVRSGSNADQYSAYRSTTGTSWTLVGGTTTIPMSSTINVGFAVCSGSASGPATADFDNIVLP